MGLKICSFSSGSSGNCIFIGSDTTKILVDIGVPTLRVERSLAALRCNSSDVSVLVTHSHSDHISGVPAFVAKHGLPTYAHYLTSAALSPKLKGQKVNEFGGEDFYIGDITVTPFRLSHDVPCVGFSFLWCGKKISIATDLGKVGDSILRQMSDSDVVFLESNHDEGLVSANQKYPFWLKKRIVGENGHLSNEACANAAVKLAKNGVKQIILGHLSKENNYPELAYSTVREKLDENGYFEGNIKVEVARAERLSGLYEVF